MGLGAGLGAGPGPSAPPSHPSSGLTSFHTQHPLWPFLARGCRVHTRPRVPLSWHQGRSPSLASLYQGPEKCRQALASLILEASGSQMQKALHAHLFCVCRPSASTASLRPHACLHSTSITERSCAPAPPGRTLPRVVAMRMMINNQQLPCAWHRQQAPSNNLGKSSRAHFPDEETEAQGVQVSCLYS